ncbi:MAG: DedA family protein, partial [Chloroflexota bacterium]
SGGRSVLERYGKYILITRHDLDRADRWFARYGDAAIFFSRLLPVVRTFISFPAGVSRMNIWKFSLYTFLGAFPWSLGLAYGGYVLGEHWERLRGVMRPFDIPIILAILALVGWYMVRHVRQANAEKKAERQAAP